MKLLSQLKKEVSNFSSNSEVANTLDALTPQFVDSTRKDLSMMKNLSDILLTACAVSAAAPEFFFLLDSRKWEKKVLKFFSQ